MDRDEAATAKVRVELAKDLFDSAIAEHSDAQANFSGMDTKAQNTAAVGGIFLAGSLALFNGASMQKLLGDGSPIAFGLLILIAALLMATTILSLWAMRIREIPRGDLKLSKEEVDAILERPEEELSARYQNYLLSRASDWAEISNRLRGVNLAKSKFVLVGQLCLGGATLVVAILLVFTLLSVWGVPVTKAC